MVENEKDAKDSNMTTVSIPRPLAEKIKKRCQGTGFNSVSSYVTYVLRQVLSNVESKEQKKEKSVAENTVEEVKDPFTKEDEENVKARLRDLGYL
ncbi:CopG family transcriptional regulator [Candidatus Woesearchaeota archaeon]|nr:CopG family transcriptional regulator [Candidatus Woesearchaeota archaeon]